MMATASIQITQRQNNWTDTVNHIIKPNLLQKNKKWVLLDALQFRFQIPKDLSQGIAPPHFQNKIKLRRITLPTETGKTNKKSAGRTHFLNKSTLRVVQLAPVTA